MIFGCSAYWAIATSYYFDSNCWVCFEGGCRDVPPAGHLLFLSRQEKKAEEGDPTVCVPALRSGQPAVLGAGGVSLELAPAALRQSRALIRHPLRSSTHTEGGGSPTSTRAIAALGPKGRRRYAPRWPERAVFSPPLVAAPASGCLRGGMRAPARMLRELTCRVCLNGAPQARSELRGAPRKRTDAGLPLRCAKGSQTAGRVSLPPFLSRDKKGGRPPGRDPASVLNRPTRRL